MPLRKSPDVVGDIFKDTSDPDIRTAMVFGSGLESGWNDTAQNPSGATGPFQILLSAHPGVTTQQAEDPKYATSYMLGSYQQAVAQVDGSLWSSNPELAAEQAAILAEKPGGTFPQNAVGSYGGESVDAVDQRWGQATQLLAAKGLKTAKLTATTNTANDQTSNNNFSGGFNTAAMGVDLATGDFPAFFSRLGDTLWNSSAVRKLALIAFAALIILIGLTKLGVHPVKSAKKVAGTATEIAGAVTAEPEIAAAGAGLKMGAGNESEN